MDSAFTFKLNNIAVDSITATAISLGWKILSAVIVILLGLLVIRGAISLLRATLPKTVHDLTIRRYIENTSRVVLWVLLLISILGVFGIQTTALAALLGAAGLAIGLALQGSLSNLAAGFMLLIFRPFKMGDLVEVAGVSGRITELGIFSTTIDTPENVRAFVPNSAIFTGVIRNRSANENLRLEIKVTIEGGADVAKAIETARQAMLANDMVMKAPVPDVQIVDDPANGITLALRPYVHVEQMDNVRTLVSQSVREQLRATGIPIVK